jgi:hypothetical protein
VSWQQRRGRVTGCDVISSPRITDTFTFTAQPTHRGVGPHLAGPAPVVARVVIRSSSVALTVTLALVGGAPSWCPPVRAAPLDAAPPSHAVATSTVGSGFGQALPHPEAGGPTIRGAPEKRCALRNDGAANGGVPWTRNTPAGGRRGCEALVWANVSPHTKAGHKLHRCSSGVKPNVHARRTHRRSQSSTSGLL